MAGMLLANGPGDWGHVLGLLEHASWHGYTPADLVFPFFLFVVGVSTALALLPRLERRRRFPSVLPPAAQRLDEQDHQQQAQQQAGAGTPQGARIAGHQVAEAESQRKQQKDRQATHLR